MLDQAWDGDWYRRGYYDDGMPLGSSQNDECRIDCDRAVVGGTVRGGSAGTRERAMDAVRSQLVRGGAGDPAAHAAVRPVGARPGYIKGYARVRENGGQYTHAALWR
jgi:cellobiose phosphorylase